MKYCPYCGAALPEAALSFCPECGEQLPGEEPKAAKKEERRTKQKRPKRAKKPRKAKTPRKAADIPPEDGYDGYYDDRVPIDEGNRRDGMDKGVIKESSRSGGRPAGGNCRLRCNFIYHLSCKSGIYQVK